MFCFVSQFPREMMSLDFLGRLQQSNFHLDSSDSSRRLSVADTQPAREARERHAGLVPPHHLPPITRIRPPLGLPDHQGGIDIRHGVLQPVVAGVVYLCPAGLAAPTTPREGLVQAVLQAGVASFRLDLHVLGPFRGASGPAAPARGPAFREGRAGEHAVPEGEGYGPGPARGAECNCTLARTHVFLLLYKVIYRR